MLKVCETREISGFKEEQTENRSPLLPPYELSYSQKEICEWDINVRDAVTIFFLARPMSDKIVLKFVKLKKGLKQFIVD